MFNNLIGNNKIKNNLIQILNSNQLFHTYMFIGTKGIGKSEFAKEFAKGILCNSNEQKPCLKCKSCLELENNNHPDYYYIGLEEENSIKIEAIRKMQAKVQELPIVSKKKVYIIDDSEYMTKEAQNSLLKTIEEPPEFVVIILITSDENKILNTIQSRCLKIYFQNISDDEIKDYLKEKHGVKNISENEIIACNGSIGKAIQIKEQKDNYIILENIFSNIEKYTLPEALIKLEILYKDKENINEMLDYINVILLNKAKENINYINYIDIVEKVKRKLNSNCNYDMTIDYLIYNIW